MMNMERRGAGFVSGDLGRTLCLITGASRGLGWSLAVALAPRLKPGSHLVLVARSGESLRQLEARLLEGSPGRAGQLRLSRVEADLSGEEGLQRVLNAADCSRAPDPDRLLLINNAGEDTFHPLLFPSNSFPMQHKCGISFPS
ncbi:sepiapterin reductase-like [Rhincodon typus]|uniref:sepiapterin reductase-like n=1 Tax=Rhincodon typus TaxID=259920 RepID=UPI002030B126|nr:sepiapterin reductase-like [Rhincodon typus]